MKNYAVLTYKYLSDKPKGVPDGYPAIVQGLGSGTTLPPGPGWQLMNETELAAQRATYQNGYDRAVRTAALDDLTKRVLAAMDFGRLLIARIAADNLSRGLTGAQIAGMMAKAQNVIMALNVGSLYIALDAISAIVPDEVMTQERLDDAKHQIQDYLGIPRT